MQIVIFGKGAKLHAAFLREEFMLRTEHQLSCHRLQIADLVQIIGFGCLFAHGNGIGVVKAQRLQKAQAIALSRHRIGIAVQGFPLGHILGVKAQKGRQQGAVIADHQITAVAIAFQRVKVIHLRHLVLNGHIQPRSVLDQHFGHAGHDLGFAVVTIIQQKALRLFACKRHQHQQQAHGCPQRQPQLFARALAAAQLFFKPAHQKVGRCGDHHQRRGALQKQAHILNANAARDHAAQTAAAHKGCKHGGADGVHHGNAHAR